MPNWKKVVTSGSNAHFNHITASGNIIASGDTYSTGDITTAGILYTDEIRRLTDNSTTTKILIGGNNINVYSGHSTNSHIQCKNNGTVFNPQGYSIWDFTVEGDTDTHLIFADAGADKVAIGTDTVSDSLLTVDGDVRTTHITASGDISSSGTLYANGMYGMEGSRIYPGGSSYGFIAANANSITVNGGSLGVDSHISASGNISSSGTITAEHLLSTDDIVARGDISSSGFVNASQYRIQGNKFVLPVTSNIFSIGEGADSSLTLTNITASGDISASGQLIGQIGALLPAYGESGHNPATSGGDIVLDHLRSYNGGGNNHTGKIRVGVGQLTIHSSNASSTALATFGLQLYGGEYGYGSGNNPNINTHLAGDLELQVANNLIAKIEPTGIDVTGHITASGNILGTNVIADNTDNGAKVSVQDADGNGIAQLARVGSGGNAHIGRMVLQDNSTLRVDISAAGTSYITGTSAKFGIGTTTPGEVLEVIGNISASSTVGAVTGSFYALQGNTSKPTGLVVNGYISASGDISAVGNVWSDNYYQFETTAKADSDDDTNWQGPNSYGILTRADWNYDYGTDYDDNSATNAESRTLMNTGWRVPHGANYSASIVNMQVYVQPNSNLTHADADNFSCSMWYSKASDLVTETNVVDASSGTFIQRHAATAISTQFKAADESLSKYNMYHVSASVGLDLAPGAMLFPRMKTVGTNNFTTVVHWVVNYKKIPL